MYRVDLPYYASEPMPSWWRNVLASPFAGHILIHNNVQQRGNAFDGYYLVFASEEDFVMFKLKYA